MPPNDVSIGFSDRNQHRRKTRLTVSLVLLTYLVPLLLLLWVDMTRRNSFLVTVAFVVLAVQYLGAPLWLWIKFIRFFGVPSLADCHRTLELDALKATLNDPNTAKGGILDVTIGLLVIAALFALLWRWSGFATFLYPAAVSLLTALKGPIRRSRPPAVLLLGGSSYEGTRLQLQLISIFDPTFVVSGLFHKENASVAVTGLLSDLHSVRTADYAKWQEMIASILRLSRLIVLDLRKVTDAVQFEIVQVTSLPDQERVYYVGEPVGSAPPARCFNEAEVINELRMKYNPGRVPPLHFPAPQVYEDKKNGYFRFTPPPGWVRQETDDPRTKVTFSHPRNPGVHLRFIVKEAGNSDFPAMLQHQKRAIREAETGLGAVCRMEVAEVDGRQTIVTRMAPRNGEVYINRLFLANGLHFSILYGAPTQMEFNAHLEEVNVSLSSLEVLERSGGNPDDLLERKTEQEIARELRLAELSADVYDIEKARAIIGRLLRNHPNHKAVQQAAQDLEQLAKDGKP